MSFSTQEELSEHLRNAHGGKEPLQGSPANQLHVEICPDGSIHLRGAIDMETAELLRQKIAEVVEPNRTVIFDMAQVTFMGSTGLQVMAEVYAITGERVVLRNPSDRVRRVLAIIDTGKPAAWVIDV